MRGKFTAAGNSLTAFMLSFQEGFLVCCYLQVRRESLTFNLSTLSLSQLPSSFVAFVMVKTNFPFKVFQRRRLSPLNCHPKESRGKYSVVFIQETD